MEKRVQTKVVLSRPLVISLVVALFVSLALNLMAAGWFAGQRIMAPERMQRGMLRQMAANLPPDVRAPLRAQVKERRRAMFSAFRDVREARKAVRTAIGKPDFDRAEMEAALAEQRRRLAELQQLMHAAMVDTAAGLDPDQRKRWSEAPLWMPGRPPKPLRQGGPPPAAPPR